MPDPTNRSPILYISDLSTDQFDPADLFDLAFLLRSPEKFTLTGVVTPKGSGENRTLDHLSTRSQNTDSLIRYSGSEEFREALRAAAEPLNIVAVAGFTLLAEVLRSDRALFREKVGRLFLVGGHANDYAIPRREGERLPIDPRLKERHPERFSPYGDLRLSGFGSPPTPSELGAGPPASPGNLAFAELLTSGEGVIWLPRDICLWRYSAQQTLSDGGVLSDWLLRELFWAKLQDGADRFAAGDAPVLLSALPAFLLATQPDPLGWLRMFRAVTARVEADGETGRVKSIAIKHERPNLYAVVGIDGRALGEVVTKTLRTRPLT